MGLNPRWPDEAPTPDKTHRVEDVLAGAFLALLFAAFMLLAFWHSARVDDDLDRVPTTFPEERYESDHPG